MWLKNDGFYFAELMLSLAGWLLITGFLVPSLIHVKKETLQVQEETAALHILYEYIQTVLIDYPERVNNTVIKENTRYELVWQEGESEVCIRYEDVQGKTKQFCERVP